MLQHQAINITAIFTGVIKPWYCTSQNVPTQGMTSEQILDVTIARKACDTDGFADAADINFLCNSPSTKCRTHFAFTCLINSPTIPSHPPLTSTFSVPYFPSATIRISSAISNYNTGLLYYITFQYFDKKYDGISSSYMRYSIFLL